jgi:hypothetical protein
VASPVVGAEGSRVERAGKSGWRPVSGTPKAWTAPLRSGWGIQLLVAVGVPGGVSAGLVPPGLGLRSPGVGLRFSGVGEAEAVAVEVGVGVAVGGCATATAAPTTVRNAAAAQLIWARRRKLATMRRRSATMERDYKPGAMAVDYNQPCDGWVGCRQATCNRAAADDRIRNAGRCGLWE